MSACLSQWYTLAAGPGVLHLPIMHVSWGNVAVPAHPPPLFLQHRAAAFVAASTVTVHCFYHSVHSESTGRPAKVETMDILLTGEARATADTGRTLVHVDDLVAHVSSRAFDLIVHAHDDAGVCITIGGVPFTPQHLPKLAGFHCALDVTVAPRASDTPAAPPTTYVRFSCSVSTCAVLHGYGRVCSAMPRFLLRPFVLVWAGHKFLWQHQGAPRW